MNHNEAAHQAGMIVADIARRFDLADGAINKACVMPDRLPVVLRHVWAKWASGEHAAALLDGFDPPPLPYPMAARGIFWLGFYSQTANREMPPPEFPARLKSLREAKSLTVQELAESAGLSRQQVHNLENPAPGRPSVPSWPTVQALAEALGVSTDAFRS